MPETVTIEVTHYSLAELKEYDERGYTKALEHLARGEAQDSWWYESTLESMVEPTQEKYGITYDPKKVMFDLDRGSHVTFDKVGTFVDERVFLKAAGIDLRTKLGRSLLENGLTIGERSSYGRTGNWIGWHFYEGLPNDLADLQPNAQGWLDNTLLDAQGEILKALRDEFDYIQGEEHLLEMAENNEWRFLEDGTMWHG